MRKPKVSEKLGLKQKFLKMLDRHLAAAMIIWATLVIVITLIVIPCAIVYLSNR